jgi:hypothetical protein
MEALLALVILIIIGPLPIGMILYHLAKSLLYRRTFHKPNARRR